MRLMTQPSDTPDTFASLGVPDLLLRTLDDLGYEAPTPIQARTIPALLAGRDLIGQAQTGTGKTAAFSLPLLARLDASKPGPQALILTPTRELAMQVAEAMHTYAKRLTGVTVLPVYGGAPIVLQMKHLARGPQIVVGTPGRLIDHLDRQTLSLDAVRMVVLDEADEMLKMGFVEEVERMLSLIPKPRQIALFSATMPEPIARIARRHLDKPVHVEIEHHGLSAPAIEQRFLNVSEGQKLEVLTQILELEPAEAALIFRRTKTGAAELAERLEARGFAAVAMHGDMKQAERESVIRRLRAGQIELVVATDVAARGLDVEQIEHVVNYDVPHDVEAYVHRIGRTGRAGRKGVATLFVTPRERRMMREIERFTGSPIKPMKIPTSADVAARRITVLKETLRKELQTGDLDLYVEVVSQLADEGPFDMTDIAAAAARIAHGGRAATKPETQVPVPRYPVPATPSAERADTRPPAPGTRSQVPGTRSRVPDSSDRSDTRPPAPGTRRPVPGTPSPDNRQPTTDNPARPRADSPGDDKVRLSMSLGKRDGIRPADVVGSIANEADVPGRDIGPIDIRDDVTYVVVPRQYVDKILEKVGRARFKGRPVDIHIATGAPPPERREKSGFVPRKPDYPPRAKPGFGPRAKPGFGPRAKPGFGPGAKPGFGPRAKPAFDPDRRPPRRDAAGGPPPKGGAFSRFSRPKPGKPGAGGPKKKR
jgi:ATP-dependent RNA helicase DeaD